MISLALTYLLVAGQVNALDSSNTQSVDIQSRFERRHHDEGDHSNHDTSKGENGADTILGPGETAVGGNGAHGIAGPGEIAAAVNGGFGIVGPGETAMGGKGGEGSMGTAMGGKGGEGSMGTGMSGASGEGSMGTGMSGASGSDVRDIIAPGSTGKISHDGHIMASGSTGMISPGSSGVIGVGSTASSGVDGSKVTKSTFQVIDGKLSEIVVTCSMGPTSNESCVTTTRQPTDATAAPAMPHMDTPAANDTMHALSSDKMSVSAAGTAGVPNKVTGARNAVETVVSGGSVMYAPAFAALGAIAGSLLI